MALLRTQPPADSEYRAVTLFHERRVAAVANGDPLAGSESVRLADLADRVVAICATAATTDASLWREGRRPCTLDVADVDEWLTMIATGDAVGVTAEGTRHIHPYPGIRYVPISDVGTVAVHLATPRQPTHPSAEAFLKHVSNAVARTHHQR